MEDSGISTGCGIATTSGVSNAGSALWDCGGESPNSVFLATWCHGGCNSFRNLARAGTGVAILPTIGIVVTGLLRTTKPGRVGHKVLVGVSNRLVSTCRKLSASKSAILAIPLALPPMLVPSKDVAASEEVSLLVCESFKLVSDVARVNAGLGLTIASITIKVPFFT